MEWNLKEFLYDEIGLEDPKVRRVNLFKKLIRLEAKHGLPVTQIIAQVWHEACELCERSTPQRMFCRVVKLRLIDAKLWHEERKFEAMTLEKILNRGVFKPHAKMPLFPDPVDRPPPRPGHHRTCQRKECTGCQ